MKTNYYKFVAGQKLAAEGDGSVISCACAIHNRQSFHFRRSATCAVHRFDPIRRFSEGEKQPKVVVDRARRLHPTFASINQVAKQAPPRSGPASCSADPRRILRVRRKPFGPAETHTSEGSSFTSWKKCLIVVAVALENALHLRQSTSV